MQWMSDFKVSWNDSMKKHLVILLLLENCFGKSRQLSEQAWKYTLKQFWHNMQK